MPSSDDDAFTDPSFWKLVDFADDVHNKDGGESRFFELATTVVPATSTFVENDGSETEGSPATSSWEGEAVAQSWVGEWEGPPGDRSWVLKVCVVGVINALLSVLNKILATPCFPEEVRRHINNNKKRA